MIMKDKINVAKLLRNCPSGMELDCTMFNDVVFNTVEFEKTIIVTRTNGTDIHLDEYGTFSNEKDAKCVIFPKGKTTWEGFVSPFKFKNGDIVAVENACGIHIFIYNHTTDEYGGYGCYVALTSFGNFKINKFCSGSTYRFATEEEKQKLFQAIKDNGYRWNSDNKSLEKLPKFKVGDRITNGKTSITIGYIDDEYYYERGIKIATRLLIKNQDDWELVPNKFNIHNLRPFDKVLVRDCDTDKWNIDFFAYYREDKGDYQCMTFTKNQCIPYESNSYLMGTTDSCREYFKTWK